MGMEEGEEQKGCELILRPLGFVSYMERNVRQHCWVMTIYVLETAHLSCSCKLWPCCA